MTGRIDWSYGADHIRAVHAIEPIWANEAANDPDRVWDQPDRASQSGVSVRVTGYSRAADDLITVILIPGDVNTERADGDWWGASAWPANSTDRRRYREN